MANRYFVDALPPPGPHVLGGDLAHHLGRVLRVRPGEVLRLGDGRGDTATATVAAVDKQAVQVLVGACQHEEPPALRVQLAFCVVRSQRVDWLFEHATEVGVTQFWPLWTARTRSQAERPERWQRIVQAAAGQCDRSWLPRVDAAQELGTFLQGALPARRLLADGHGAAIAAADRGPGDVVLLAGPEGGFDTAEIAAITAAGFAPRRFGPHTLRTETAALIGAAVLLADEVGGAT